MTYVTELSTVRMVYRDGWTGNSPLVPQWNRYSGLHAVLAMLATAIADSVASGVDIDPETVALYRRVNKRCRAAVPRGAGVTPGP